MKQNLLDHYVLDEPFTNAGAMTGITMRIDSFNKAGWFIKQIDYIRQQHGNGREISVFTLYEKEVP